MITVQHRKENGDPSGSREVTVIEGPEQTQRAFVSMFGARIHGRRSKAAKPVR